MIDLYAEKWQHGWRLAVAVIGGLAVWPGLLIVGLFIAGWVSLRNVEGQPPVEWRGLDRSAVTCDSDGWLSDDRMTCIGGQRRYLCVRENRDYQCTETP